MQVQVKNIEDGGYDSNAQCNVENVTLSNGQHTVLIKGVVSIQECSNEDLEWLFNDAIARVTKGEEGYKLL